MKTTDRFLVGIVLGVVLLVVVSIFLVLTRTPPSYKADDSAENVAYNYLLALQQGNYARAYGYLSPSLSGYPSSLDRFTASLRTNGYNLPPGDNSVSLEIAGSRVVVSSLETVEVSVRRTQFSGGGLFGPGQYSSLFSMQLQKENGAWKIIWSDAFFMNCWARAAGCP